MAPLRGKNEGVDKLTIYIFTISLSSLLLFLADHDSDYRKYNKSKNRIILYYFVFFMMATLAGGRALSVGSDTGYYGIGIFRIVNNYNMSDLYSNLFTTVIGTQTFEPGYVFLNFIVSRITNSTFILFFLISFLTMFIAFKAFEKNNINCPTWIAMSFYFLTYFNESMNLIRQSLAGAIMIYAITYLRKKNYVRFLLIMVIACLFHFGAAIGFVYLFVKILIEGKWSALKKLIVIFLVFLTLYMLPQIVFYAYENGLLSARYTWYFESGKSLIININQIIIRLPMIVMFILNYKDILNRDENGQLLFVMLISDLIFSQGGAYGNASYRIGSYFGYSKAFAYPLTASCKTGKYRNLSNLLSFMIVISMWVFSILIKNYNSTIPYIWDPTDI